MAFTQAAMSVQLIYQKVALSAVPFMIDESTKLGVPNPRYQAWKQMLARHFIHLLGFILILVLTYRLKWLYVNWQTYTFSHREEAIVYLIILQSLLIYISFAYTLEVEISTFTFTVNQVLIIRRQLHKSPSFGDVPKKCVVYGLTLGWLLCNVAFAVGPFVISYCPVQLILGRSLPSKLLGSFLYTLIGIHGLSIYSCVYLLSFVFLEGVTDFSAELQPKQICKSNLLLASKFKYHYRIYTALRILLEAAAQNSQLMFTVLIFVGIFLISCAGYTTLAMYRELNVLVYYAIFFLFVLGILVAILFTALASIPGRNVERFCKFWKRVLRTKVSRLLLRSVPVIGFKLGPYGVVSTRLGLSICEDIINNVISLLMLQN